MCCTSAGVSVELRAAPVKSHSAGVGGEHCGAESWFAAVHSDKKVNLSSTAPHPHPQPPPSPISVRHSDSFQDNISSKPSEMENIWLTEQLIHKHKHVYDEERKHILWGGGGGGIIETLYTIHSIAQ